MIFNFIGSTTNHVASQTKIFVLLLCILQILKNCAVIQLFFHIHAPVHKRLQFLLAFQNAKQIPAQDILLASQDDKDKGSITE